MGRLTGGGNRLECFARSTNAAGTSQIAFTRILNSDIAKQDDGTWVITLSQEEDSQALYDFIEDYGNDGEATEEEEVTYEDSTTDGGGTSSTQPEILIVLYGPATAATGGTRKTLRALAKVQAGAGSWKQEAGKSTQPAISIKTMAADAELTIAGAKFDATLVTAGGDKTIAAGNKGTIEFMTNP